MLLVSGFSNGLQVKDQQSSIGASTVLVSDNRCASHVKVRKSCTIMDLAAWQAFKSGSDDRFMKTKLLRTILATQLLCLMNLSIASEGSPRARDLGVPFEGQPGPLNAITDVAGVSVGQVTLIHGDGELKVGHGPVRTGVTAIHPRGNDSTEAVFGGWFTLNASGEMTGTTWLEERGLVDGPIMITNTHSVGVVRDAAVAWMVDKSWEADWHAPIVGETYDGALNDINGFHVTREHALEALAKATTGAVEEGAVGGGTGMICNGFKGGIGTASRVFEAAGKQRTVGVLVQCNYNWTREPLRIAGHPVGKTLEADANCFTDRKIKPHMDWFPFCDEITKPVEPAGRDGSIIIVIATDAPLLPHQLKRMAKRPTLALGRLGTWSNDGSGDIFIAFSTGSAGRISEHSESTVEMYPNNGLSRLFQATVEATEEAIVNAMVAADTTIGASGLRIVELPEKALGEMMADQDKP
jgi:L-aminopeptidase/D-esterase-like protein